MVVLRDLAKPHRHDHALAFALWAQPIHEAQLLAVLTADPQQFTPDLMDAWITDFDTWDICDQACLNVFRRTPYAFDKVTAWADREPEFERRAAFALVATLGVHAKKEPDATFLALLPLIDQAADDHRNFVKKPSTGRFAKSASAAAKPFSPPPSTSPKIFPPANPKAPAGSAKTPSASSRKNNTP